MAEDLATTLTAKPYRGVSDEALVVQRQSVVQQLKDPHLNAGQNLVAASTAILIGSGITYAVSSWAKSAIAKGSTNGVAKWLNSGSGQFSTTVGTSLVTLFGTTVALTKKKMESLVPQLEELNEEVSFRSGKTPDQIANSPITAADLQRMKEANQSGKDLKSQVEKLVTQAETTPLISGVGGR